MFHVNRRPIPLQFCGDLIPTFLPSLRQRRQPFQRRVQHRDGFHGMRNSLSLHQVIQRLAGHLVVLLRSFFRQQMQLHPCREPGHFGACRMAMQHLLRHCLLMQLQKLQIRFQSIPIDRHLSRHQQKGSQLDQHDRSQASPLLFGKHRLRKHKRG